MSTESFQNDTDKVVVPPTENPKEEVAARPELSRQVVMPGGELELVTGSSESELIEKIKDLREGDR